MQIFVYRNSSGKEPYADWYSKLKDPAGRNRIRATLAKLEQDNPEPLKRLKGQDDLWEIRVMGQGPGYRLYCLIEGQTLIILLGAGIKKSQSKDIRKAEVEANDYRNRNPLG